MQAVTSGCRLRHLLLRCWLPPVGSSAPSRMYNVALPVPSIDRDDVYALTIGKNSQNKKSDIRGYGHPLSKDDYDILGESKRQGYIAATNTTSQPLFNKYYTYCWSTRRPYVAINRHGSSVYVDATPVLSLFREKQADALAKVLKALASTAATSTVAGPADAQLQIVKAESLKRQAALTMPGPFEGSSIQKIADKEPGDVFTVYCGGRDQARRVAEQFHLAYCAVANQPTPVQIKAAKAARQEAKKEAYRRLMIRKLRKLVADDVAVKQLRVAAGAVDGFLAADKQGLVQ